MSDTCPRCGRTVSESSLPNGLCENEPQCDYAAGLRAERDALLDLTITEPMRERDAAMAERDRYREALERICDYASTNADDNEVAVYAQQESKRALEAGDD